MKHKQILKSRNTQTSKLQLKYQQDRTCGTVRNWVYRFGLKFPPCRIGPAAVTPNFTSFFLFNMRVSNPTLGFLVCDPTCRFFDSWCGCRQISEDWQQMWCGTGRRAAVITHSLNSGTRGWRSDPISGLTRPVYKYRDRNLGNHTRQPPSGRSHTDFTVDFPRFGATHTNNRKTICGITHQETRCGIGNAMVSVIKILTLRAEFLLKTESGYLRDAEVTWFTLANP